MWIRLGWKYSLTKQVLAADLWHLAGWATSLGWASFLLPSSSLNPIFFFFWKLFLTGWVASPRTGLIIQTRLKKLVRLLSKLFESFGREGKFFRTLMISIKLVAFNLQGWLFCFFTELCQCLSYKMKTSSFSLRVMRRVSLFFLLPDIYQHKCKWSLS